MNSFDDEQHSFIFDNFMMPPTMVTYAILIIIIIGLEEMMSFRLS